MNFLPFFFHDLVIISVFFNILDTNMKLFLPHLVFLCLFVDCMSVSRCHYKNFDILFALQRESSLCESNVKATENIFFSNPKVVSSNQDSINSAEVIRISEPHILCLDIVARNKTNSSLIVLTWSWSEINISPLIFKIEVRNNSDPIGDWNTVGLTNATSAAISNLDLLLEYQFRVTPVSGTNSLLLSMLSKWIKLLDLSFPVSSPTRISISEFQVKNGLVDAIMKWTTFEEMPCSYRLHWLPASGINPHQKVIELPHDLSVILPGLNFETNYTLTIMPNGVSRKNMLAKLLFLTPKCLDLTGRNYSICAPDCPQNVSVYWSSYNEATVNWMQPVFASYKNPISAYTISVFKSSDIYNDFTQNIISKRVKKDYSNVTFQHLDPTITYTFEVRAVSKGGIGNIAAVELGSQRLAGKGSIYSLPCQYVFTGFASVVVVAIVMVLYCKKMHRNVAMSLVVLSKKSERAHTNDYC